MNKISITTLEPKEIAILNGTDRIRRDKAKGKAIENLCKEALYHFGADIVYDYEDMQEQISIGDLKVIKDDKVFQVECKSSHSFRGIDKLAIDIKYLDKYNTRKDYIQSTTNSSLGWIYYSQSDWIMCYNSDSKKLYVIRDYQEVKKNILDKVDSYIESFKNIDGFQAWYRRNHNNTIDGYLLEGSVKEDTNKFALIVNLMLSKGTIEKYGGRLDIFDIELIEDKKITPSAANTRVTTK